MNKHDATLLDVEGIAEILYAFDLFKDPVRFRSECEWATNEFETPSALDFRREPAPFELPDDVFRRAFLCFCHISRGFVPPFVIMVDLFFVPVA